jgi:hypothetical protein
MKWAALTLLTVVGVKLPTYHLQHERVFATGTNEINRAVLAAVDRIQATAPDGGGYFTGVKAVPAESPIGVPVSLFGQPLLSPPRCTSYCSGASYSALIGALDSLLAPRSSDLTTERQEAVRMQEPNGGRREDMVKLWGWWNADGPGSLYALAMYTQMGQRVGALDAEPGDFCNINWVKGPGHSVVFLGWDSTAEGEPTMRYWSSQKGTNGLGDQTSTLASMSGIVFTRLTRPEALFEFDPNKKMERLKIEYDSATIVAERLKRSGGLETRTLVR